MLLKSHARPELHPQSIFAVSNSLFQIRTTCSISGVSLDIVHFLSDAKVKDEDGSTPLHSACRKKCKNVIDDSEDDTSDPEKQVSGTYA